MNRTTDSAVLKTKELLLVKLCTIVFIQYQSRPSPHPARSQKSKSNQKMSPDPTRLLTPYLVKVASKIKHHHPTKNLNQCKQLHQCTVMIYNPTIRYHPEEGGSLLGTFFFRSVHQGSTRYIKIDIQRHYEIKSWKPDRPSRGLESKRAKLEGVIVPPSIRVTLTNHELMYVKEDS